VVAAGAAAGLTRRRTRTFTVIGLVGDNRRGGGAVRARPLTVPSSRPLEASAMLRRVLVTGVYLCAAVAVQAALGSAVGSASGVSLASATAPATTRLMPGVQHSAHRRDASGGGRAGSAELGATGNGVNADPFGTCISCTGAGAGNNSSSSDSQGLHLADESVAEGQSPANGYASGEIASVPANPLFGLVLGSWDTSNHATPASSEAHSKATFANLRVADGRLATVAVFDARSDATYTSRGSHGSATTNGVTATIGNGQLVVILLHSDADSDAPGHVYVAHVNDSEIMSSKEVSGGVPITVPNVASIALLSVTKGGAVVGGVNDGKSQQALGIVTSSAGGERRRPS
jgi:hypothetical protein